MLAKRNAQKRTIVAVSAHFGEIVLRGADVGNVKRSMVAYPPKPWIITTDLDAPKGYWTKMSARDHVVPLAESQHHIINPTNPCSALDDSVEDRLYVRG